MVSTQISELPDRQHRQAHYPDLTGQVIYPQDVDNDTSGTSSDDNQGIELPQNTHFRRAGLLKPRAREDGDHVYGDNSSI